MPWAKNDDLPDDVKDALPAEAQSVWRDVANKALEDGDDEATAAKKAWGAVKGARWEKVGDKWVKTTKNAEGAKVVTLTGIKIVRTGTWAASTGVTTITEEDLEDIVAASTDPEIDEAVLKLGHKDPINETVLRDGAPALGHFTNLRVEDEFLVGDLEGVPAPLAKVMPHAYKRRSAEIAWGVRTKAGNTYRAALTAVSLLGKFAPAVKGLGSPIETLEDLYELYGLEAPEVKEEAANFSAEKVSAMAQGEGIEQVSRTELAPAFNIDRIRNAYRAEHPYDPDDPSSDRWVREVWLTPGSAAGWLIIEGPATEAELDTNELIRVAWKVNDEGEVDFGPDEKVEVTYTPAQTAARSAALTQYVARKIDRATAQTLLAAIETPDDAIPGAVSGGNPRQSGEPSDNGSKARIEEAHNMDEKRIGELLKEEDEAKAVEEFKKLRAESATPPAGGDGNGNGDGNGEGKPEGETPPVKPEGEGQPAGETTKEPAMATLSADEVAELRQQAKDGNEARSILRQQEIKNVLRSALSAGRIVPADVEDVKDEKGETTKVGWRSRLSADFDGTKSLLESLTPAFPTSELGDDSAEESIELAAAEDKAFDAFMESTFPELAGSSNEGGK